MNAKGNNMNMKRWKLRICVEVEVWYMDIIVDAATNVDAAFKAALLIENRSPTGWGHSQVVDCVELTDCFSLHKK